MRLGELCGWRGLMLFGAVTMLAGCRATTDRSDAAGPVSAANPVAHGAPAGDPHIADCPVFPADNVWNARIDSLPRDPRSNDYLDSIGVTQRLHADFGTSPFVGIPVTIAKPDAPPVRIKFQYDGESDHVAYPLERRVAIEGGPQSTGDRHVVMVDPRDCSIFELWHVSARPGGDWTAGSGMTMNLRSDALRKDGFTSADAAGLPILPGLVRYDEVAAGEIRHALRFTVQRSQHAYVWPARHQASNDRNPNQPPLGVRLRLRADFDISKYPRIDRVILLALQRYGMFLADMGSSIYLSGIPDARWNDDDLHRLEEIKGEDLEVVDESSLQVGPDSGAATPSKIISPHS